MCCSCSFGLEWVGLGSISFNSAFQCRIPKTYRYMPIFLGKMCQIYDLVLVCHSSCLLLYIKKCQTESFNICPCQITFKHTRFVFLGCGRCRLSILERECKKFSVRASGKEKVKKGREIGKLKLVSSAGFSELCIHGFNKAGKEQLVLMVKVLTMFDCCAVYLTCH